jgi:phthiocerol/phenolphthiocerol synthesis type-I polyketide synthase E
LSSEDKKIHNRIEILYDDTLLTRAEDHEPDTKETSKKRNVSGVFVAPETAIEKIVAEYWGGVLGYQPVGVLDNYFEVGGNSLLATKLMASLSDEFNTKLSFRELSECLTIKELAALIDSRKRVMELVSQVGAADNNHDNYIEI